MKEVYQQNMSILSEKETDLIHKIVTQSREQSGIFLSEEVRCEIEELGLDSLTIMRAVMKEYSYLFKELNK